MGCGGGEAALSGELDPVADICAEQGTATVSAAATNQARPDMALLS
jgi:hypothetical protein